MRSSSFLRTIVLALWSFSCSSASAPLLHAPTEPTHRVSALETHLQRELLRRKAANGGNSGRVQNIPQFMRDEGEESIHEAEDKVVNLRAWEQKNGYRKESNRALEYYENDGDDGNANADDANVVDDAVEDDGNDGDDDKFDADYLCSQYLMSFIEGTTDAKDNCEGIQNAYAAAYCQSKEYEYEGDDDHDDYFVNYNQFSCCKALKNHYDVYCSESQIITNMHLLLIASVLLLCEMAKAVIKSKELHWLPEAGGCMIVGTLVGAIAHVLPGVTLDDLSFDEELFLCVLLPPIIFEAALTVNKKEFKRRRMAILLFSVLGTILCTFMTGFLIHYASVYFDSVKRIPLLDCMIFGALISSIDPVAILSVLTSLKLTEEDTVYIMVFGESLLNDGVAITLFKSLLRHYNSSAGHVDADEIFGTSADFLIVGFGSMVIGLVCGFAALIYFWFLKKRLNAPMEVASFFLWAGIPYYICDELGWSGIVAIVTVGFFMDIYITTPKEHEKVAIITKPHEGNNNNLFGLPQSAVEGGNYVDMDEGQIGNMDHGRGPFGMPAKTDSSPSARSMYSLRSFRSFRSIRTLNMRQLLFREEQFRLSREADRHVRFVAHLLAQLSENCIFVYLGLFLFSKYYVWEMPLVILSIFACVASRAVMVSIICKLIWYINVFRQKCGCYKPNLLLEASEPQVSRTAIALQDKSIQLVLVLSGLRGAVSLALVESVPIYNAVTGEGTEFKGIMKAMTSGSIIFTIFVLGGSAYYILQNLDIRAPDRQDSSRSADQTPVASPKQMMRPRPESPIQKGHLFT